MTDKMNQTIREYLGHALPECRVVIHRNGEIERYGSPDPADRSQDFWQYVGTVDKIKAQMMSNICDCDEAEGVHEHCAGCDCVLNYYESENHCVSCEEPMADFVVREYYLNQKPPREIESVVQAKTAIDAIRSKSFWRYASHFTTRQGDVDQQAHTQDGDGRNGCDAERKKST